MRPLEILLSLFTIAVIAVLPHTGLLPNFAYSIPILILVWFALKFSGERFKDIGFSFKGFEFKAIPIGLLVAVLTLAFMQLIFFPTLELFVSFEETDVELYDLIRENLFQCILLIFFGWLIGGFYEEIVFHAFIYTRLEKMIRGKYAASINFFLTAMIFGVYHIQLGADGLINAFVVGCVYLALYLYFKRNLWYSIICHGFYNTLVMILIHLGYL